MTPMNFKYEISGDTVNAAISGRLDTITSPQFAIDIMPVADNADKHIILDCKELAYVSSSGLRQLMLLRKQTIAKGGDITMLNVSKDVRQVFTIAGFEPLFIFR